MKDIIRIKYEVNSARDSLKLKLEQKELIKYNNWKAQPENTSSREAMEKVVAKLKLEDEVWILEEKEGLEFITKIEQNWIEEFDLGEYL